MLDRTVTIAGYEYSDWQLAHARFIAAQLSPPQRELMKRHALGPQALVVATDAGVVTFRMLDRNLLKRDNRSGGRYTVPTVDGRLVIAVLLADEADALSAEAMIRQEEPVG